METEGKIWGLWVIRRKERELNSNEKLKMFFIINNNIITAVIWTPVGFDTALCKENRKKWQSRLLDYYSLKRFDKENIGEGRKG